MFFMVFLVFILCYKPKKSGNINFGAAEVKMRKFNF